MRSLKTKLAALITSFFLSFPLFAGCEKIVNGKKSPYNGESIEGLVIDKKAIDTLNRLYPALYITERIFTGTIQTCSADCKNNFITCTPN